MRFSLAKYIIVKVPLNSRKRLSKAKITTTKVSRLIQSIKRYYVLEKNFPVRKESDYTIATDLNPYFDM